MKFRVTRAGNFPQFTPPPPNPRTDLPMPSLATQAANALQTAGRAFYGAMRGKVVVASEEQKRRLAICQACPEFNALRERCSKCGCFSAVKTWMAMEKCPLRKW